MLLVKIEVLLSSALEWKLFCSTSYIAAAFLFKDFQLSLVINFAAWRISYFIIRFWMLLPRVSALFVLLSTFLSAFSLKKQRAILLTGT